MGKPKHWFSRITLFGVLTALSVPALGNVRLAFDSTNLDFGTVALSGTRELVVKAWDTSAVLTKITQLSVAGLDPADFSIVSPSQYPLVIFPGTVDTQQIILEFSPQEVGSRSAELVIVTSDGTVILSLSGFGTGGPSLSWTVPSINFGMIAPGSEIDTVIELYSTGMDTVFLDDIVVASSDTSFAAEFASNIVPPVVLAPGDSVAVQVAFRGLPDTGIKNAQLTTFSNLLNTPTCDLIGGDEFGSFTTLPSPLIDFGVMYVGQVIDTTIELINTGDVSLLFEGPDVSISGEDFTLINPVQFPYMLPAGDTLPIAIEANPGLNTSHRAYLQVFSPQSVEANHYQQDTLTVSVIPSPITTPSLQPLSYYCAIVSSIADTIPISNSGPQTVVISSIASIVGDASSDTSIALAANVSFPDTISSGTTQPVIIHFRPTSTTADTLVVAMMGGMQVMIADTIILQPLITQATVSIAAVAATGTEEQPISVSTTTGLTPFDLDSIIVHIAVLDSNIATIDPSTIALAPGIPNATIRSVIQEPGGFTVTVTSTAPITVPAGSPVLEMSLSRYVSSSALTGVTASIETPELAGCLNWAADTIAVSGYKTCGSAELQNFLSEQPLDMVAVLRENPVFGQNAELSIASSQTGDIRYELTNALGQMRFERYLYIVSGSHNYELSMLGIPSGIYTIRLIPQTGIAQNLRLVKID